MSDDLVDLVHRCLVELCEEQALEAPAGVGPDTALFGPDGLLDSIALVSLVVAVEEAVEDAHGVSVTLADQRALSRSKSPFRTVGALAAYCRERIEAGD